MAREKINYAICEAIVNNLWYKGLISEKERAKILEDVAKTFSLKIEV